MPSQREHQEKFFFSWGATLFLWTRESFPAFPWLFIGTISTIHFRNSLVHTTVRCHVEASAGVVPFSHPWCRTCQRVTTSTTVLLLSLLCTLYTSMRQDVPFTLWERFRKHLRSMDREKKYLSSPFRSILIENMGTMNSMPFPTSVRDSRYQALHRIQRRSFFLLTSSATEKELLSPKR